MPKLDLTKPVQTRDGRCIPDELDEHPDDLVNVPETVKRYYPVSRLAPTLQVWEYDQNTCEAIGFESLQDCRDNGYLGPVIEIVFVDGTATAVNLI